MTMGKVASRIRMAAEARTRAMLAASPPPVAVKPMALAVRAAVRAMVLEILARKNAKYFEPIDAKNVRMPGSVNVTPGTVAKGT